MHRMVTGRSRQKQPKNNLVKCNTKNTIKKQNDYQDNNLEMEPHSNIAHNRRKHIDFYVNTYVSMCLCGSNKLMFSSSG